MGEGAGQLRFEDVLDALRHVGAPVDKWLTAATTSVEGELDLAEGLKRLRETGPLEEWLSAVPFAELGLSQRSQDILRDAGIRIVGELQVFSGDELLDLNLGFDEASIEEIKVLLALLGIEWS